jgi:hypothetical protein
MPRNANDGRFILDAEREKLLRAYAKGDITWRSLRAKGMDSYLDVLGGLGELGLRPPVAPMDGPNVESRMRSRAIIRAALEAQKE